MSGDVIPVGDDILTIISFENCGSTELCLSEGIITQYGGAWVEPEYGECVDMQVDIGDANLDDGVNVVDIVAIVGHIFGTEIFTGCQFWAADINQDGAINVVDIVYLIEIILGRNLTKAEPVTAPSLNFGNGAVILHEQGKVAGMQLSVSGNHIITKSNVPDSLKFHVNNNTILMFSLDGSPLNSNALFEYSGNLTIESALITDWYGNGIYADIEVLPESFSPGQAYPNPFNPVATLEYYLPKEAYVSIKVFDLTGLQVAALLPDNTFTSAGSYLVKFNAHGFPSGLYFVAMRAKSADEELIARQKVVLLK